MLMKRRFYQSQNKKDNPYVHDACLCLRNFIPVQKLLTLHGSSTELADVATRGCFINVCGLYNSLSCMVNYNY